MSGFDFGHEVERLMQKASEKENAVEKDRSWEDDADEETVGVEILLLWEAMPVFSAKLVEEFTEVNQKHCKRWRNLVDFSKKFKANLRSARNSKTCALTIFRLRKLKSVITTWKPIRKMNQVSLHSI